MLIDCHVKYFSTEKYMNIICVYAMFGKTCMIYLTNDRMRKTIIVFRMWQFSVIHETWNYLSTVKCYKMTKLSTCWLYDDYYALLISSITLFNS